MDALACRRAYGTSAQQATEREISQGWAEWNLPDTSTISPSPLARFHPSHSKSSGPPILPDASMTRSLIPPTRVG